MYIILVQLYAVTDVFRTRYLTNPENMAKCKCLEMSVMDLSFIHKEIVSR